MLKAMAVTTIAASGVFISLFLAACGSSQNASAPASSPSPSPHFVAVPAASTKLANVQSGDPWAYVIVFDEQGLRPGQSVTYSLTAEASANYACNSNTALAQLKPQVASGTVTASGRFTADSSGGINQSVTLKPPAASDATCPSGYSLGIWKISYDNVELRDTTNSVSQTMPGRGGVAN